MERHQLAGREALDPAEHRPSTGRRRKDRLLEEDDAHDSEMLGVLESWRARTQFSSDDDWVFASPVQFGRLRWSADGVNDAYRKATSIAGIGHVSTHTMRHTYRSWLDAVGTPIAIQQKLMRHADIRTTMNVYGDVVTDEMELAHSKVVRMALAPVN